MVKDELHELVDQLSQDARMRTVHRVRIRPLEFDRKPPKGSWE